MMAGRKHSTSPWSKYPWAICSAMRRAPNWNGLTLEHWVTARLRGIFGYVADPVTLYSLNRPLFLFYFAVVYPSEKAWQLTRANR